MIRKLHTVAMVAITVFGSLAVATAAEPKEAGGKTKEPAEGTRCGPWQGCEAGNGLDSRRRVYDGFARFGQGRLGGEKPQHRVRITKPFYLGKYLVTQEQWEAAMGSNPSYFKGPKNPVETVSWDDCQTVSRKAQCGDGQAGPEVRIAHGGAVGVCLPGREHRLAITLADDARRLDEYAWYDRTQATRPIL